MDRLSTITPHTHTFIQGVGSALRVTARWERGYTGFRARSQGLPENEEAGGE